MRVHRPGGIREGLPPSSAPPGPESAGAAAPRRRPHPSRQTIALSFMLVAPEVLLCRSSVEVLLAAPGRARAPRGLRGEPAAEVGLVDPHGARRDARRGAAEDVGLGRRRERGPHEGRREAAREVAEARPGQEKGEKFPTLEAPISIVFHSIWLIFGRGIVSRGELKAWMPFCRNPLREHPR